jgi:hypothetical protein
MAEVRITVNGRRALTVRQALDRYQDYHRITSMEAMYSIIRRAGLEADGQIDGRTPVYLARKLDAVMASRPGKGNRR